MVLEAPPLTVDRAAPGRPARPAERFSPLIQGLRAVAVVSVVLFHLWPRALPGGYVGVDVFFVISGYLICGHLMRELESTGRIRLARFWARRIRRLLPAALTVVVVCVVFVLVAVPAVGWTQNLRELRAAAAYVENWQLAADAVDYLAATNQPSLVQHFWSLSVEEQFYFLQPLLLLGVFLIARRRRSIVIALVTVIVLSGAYSVALTALQPGAAYFSTGTRAWEFAVGGLVAAIPLRYRAPWLRASTGWIGLAMIAAAVACFDSSTPFPGFAAALPVAGAALLLRTSDDITAGSVGRVLGSPPFRRIGDWSYAIYLWHWPLIVAVPIVLGRLADWKLKFALLVVVVLLAALTKRFVEDRWRGSLNGRQVVRSFVAMIAAVALILGATTTALAAQRSIISSLSKDSASAFAALPGTCVGAGAVLHHCDRPYAVTSTVVPVVAADDVPWNRGVAAQQRCGGASNVAPVVVHECVFSNPADPVHTVALVGDSHADHLVDPIADAARRYGWRLLTFTREGCSGIPSAAEPDARCRAWSADLQRHLLQRSDIDVVAYSNYSSAESWSTADAESAWRPLLEAGKAVVPIVDVPGMPDGVKAPACVGTAHGAYDPCATPIPPTGKMRHAAEALDLRAVDLTDVFCGGGRCHTVIGGAIVYMDEAHLTLTFSYSLREVLGARIRAVLGADRAGS